MTARAANCDQAGIQTGMPAGSEAEPLAATIADCRLPIAANNREHAPQLASNEQHESLLSHKQLKKKA